MKKVLVSLALAAALIGGYVGYRFYAAGDKSVKYRTATVTRGDLVVTVRATGTLEPEDLVDVGAQVIGRVKELGTDASGKPIDYGAQVEANQVLATIDDSVYRAQWNQAQAALERARADLLQLQARLKQAEADWLRAKMLSQSPSGAISQSEVDLARANLDVAKANVEVGRAQIGQNAAALQLAETNLGYTVIRSPVAGTIIDRRINIGQTVVANLNAPSLFLIAKDLRRMQVWASVNEADIGLLKVDMPVTFSVDAFPDDVFHGNVSQIRLNATMTQNVVTYTVVVSSDNSDLKLLPYLTADVKFLVKNLERVLLVPNAALRYRPAAERILPEAGEPSAQGGAARGRGPAEAAAHAEPSQPAPAGKPGRVWRRRGDFVAPVDVVLGDTDDAHTEIRSGHLVEGDEVVLGESEAAVAKEVTNPFAPPRFPRSRPTQPREER